MLTRFDENKKEVFLSSNTLKTKNWSFVTLEIVDSEFKLKINNKIDVIFVSTDFFDTAESGNEEEHTTEQENIEEPIMLKVQESFLVNDPILVGEMDISYDMYYGEVKEAYKNNQPLNANKFSGYFNFQSLKQNLTMKNGTDGGTLHQTLRFKVEGLMERGPNQDKKMEFRDIVELCKKFVFDFKSKANPVYSPNTIVANRKLIIKEIGSIMSKYVFIHKGLTLFSPPIYNDQVDDPFTFLPYNKVMRDGEYRDSYPLYPIDLKGFRNFFKRHFNISEEAIETMIRLAKETPFFWQKASGSGETVKNVIFYDKLMYCFINVFLEAEQVDMIKETLIVLNSFEPISIDEESEKRINFLNNLSPVLQDEYLRKNIKAVPIKNMNYDRIEMIETEEVEKGLLKQLKSICFVKLDDSKGVKLVLTDEEDQTKEHEFDLILQENTLLDFSEEFINEIVIRTDTNGEIKRLTFKTNVRKIKLGTKDVKEMLIRTAFQPSNLFRNLFFITQKSKLMTILFLYEEKEFIRDFDFLKQQDIMPSPFDLAEIKDVKLRFDLSYFSMAQLDKYKNSISVLKYDVNLYTKKVNQIIDFLESIFESSSVYANNIEPSNIGEFSVYMLGVKDGVIPGKKKPITHLKLDSYFLFRNKRNNHFPSIDMIYYKICELILKNSEPSILSQKQESYLQQSGLYVDEIKRDRIEEEMIENEAFLMTKRQDSMPEVMRCVNYTCGKEFEVSNNEQCVGHTGTWDFGHTGVTIVETLIEYDKPKSNKILWKAHWTCCGRSWEESCSAIHQHTGEYFDQSKRIEIDTEDKAFKKVFKKRVRKTWINQLKKFYKLGKSQVKTKIKYFASGKYVSPGEIPIDLLPHLCDALNMHLLVISDDMSYHFKLLDLINKKAFTYLQTKNGFINIPKFVQWWFCELSELESFENVEDKVEE